MLAIISTGFIQATDAETMHIDFISSSPPSFPTTSALFLNYKVLFTRKVWGVFLWVSNLWCCIMTNRPALDLTITYQDNSDRMIKCAGCILCRVRRNAAPTIARNKLFCCCWCHRRMEIKSNSATIRLWVMAVSRCLYISGEGGGGGGVSCSNGGGFLCFLFCVILY